MSMNEIYPPNGPHNKVSLPVIDKDQWRIVPGSPVKVGEFVGVAQTALEAVDGGTTGVVNSNAPGNVTVWNNGTWRLPVDTTTTAPAIGNKVFAAVEGGTNLVKLYSNSVTGRIPFGVFYEAATAGAGTKNLAVRVFEYAGPAV